MMPLFGQAESYPRKRLEVGCIVTHNGIGECVDDWSTETPTKGHQGIVSDIKHYVWVAFTGYEGRCQAADLTVVMTAEEAKRAIMNTKSPQALQIINLAKDYLQAPGLDPLRDSQVRYTQDEGTETIFIDPHGDLWNLPGVRVRFYIYANPAGFASSVHGHVYVITDATEQGNRNALNLPVRPTWLAIELDVDNLEAGVLGWCATVVQLLYNSPLAYTSVSQAPFSIQEPPQPFGHEDDARQILVIRHGETVEITRKTWKITSRLRGGNTFKFPENLAPHIRKGSLDPALEMVL